MSSQIIKSLTFYEHVFDIQCISLSVYCQGRVIIIKFVPFYVIFLYVCSTLVGAKYFSPFLDRRGAGMGRMIIRPYGVVIFLLPGTSGGLR
jgi:hypothetical protein